MLSSGSELFWLDTIVLIVVYLSVLLAVDIVFGCHVSKCVGVVWSGLNDFAFAKTQPLNMLVCRRHPIYIVVASIASPLIELQSALGSPLHPCAVVAFAGIFSWKLLQKFLVLLSFFYFIIDFVYVSLLKIVLRKHFVMASSRNVGTV